MHCNAFQSELWRSRYIDYLQKNRLHHEIRKAAAEYQCKRAVEREVVERFRPRTQEEAPPHAAENNTAKTYREFAEKWLPIHARKERFSPNSYDSYRSNLDRHILPYFGDRVMSSITAEDIDDFLDSLSRKPCRGPKSYGKRPEDIPTLSSSTVKKCFTILTSGFETAKKWHYISEIPKVTAPTEKTVKRRAWDARRVYEVLDSIKEDELLHLAVHLAFVCSLRAGETAGIDLHTIDFRDGSLWITRQIQRVSDSAIGVLPKHEVLRIFPKQVLTSKSSMILKGPKTEDSHRKQYLTTPLLNELRERLARIEENKAFLLSKSGCLFIHIVCRSHQHCWGLRSLVRMRSPVRIRVSAPDSRLCETTRRGDFLCIVRFFSFSSSLGREVPLASGLGFQLTFRAHFRTPSSFWPLDGLDDYAPNECA